MTPGVGVTTLGIHAGCDEGTHVTSGHTEKAAQNERAGLRHRLLDAAEELFLKQDPGDVHLAQIAEHADVAQADLDELFPTRSDLVGDLAARLYLRGYPFEYGPERTGDLRWFLEAYLGNQTKPGHRLIWKLGEELNREKPRDPDAAYWHVVGDIELRLVQAGIDGPTAHKRSLVLTPALIQLANRVAHDYTTAEEIADFIDAACNLGLSS